jgi:transposase
MRKYNKEFRQGAMDLVMKEGRGPTEVARELGIPANTLFNWLKKAGWSHSVNPQSPVPDDVRALKLQVQDLQAQNRRLQMEKDILKKATAYFASQSL